MNPLPQAGLQSIQQGMNMMQVQVQRQLQAQMQAQLELQKKELELRERAQENDFQLKSRMQDAEIELRRLAIDRADENEKAASKRLAESDTRNANYASRGQTYAMWFTGIAAGALGVSGLLCIFLAVFGVISVAAGVTAGGILLAGSLFSGISSLVAKFLRSR